MIRNLPSPRKAAIFDLGGVLLALDPPAQDAAFRRLGATRDFSELTADPEAKKVLDGFEVGALTAREFREGIGPYLGLGPVTPTDFDEAFAAILGDFLDENLAKLGELRPHRHLYLLSNTNGVHASLFEASFERQHGRPFRGLFDEVYYSHELGRRKPDAEAFLHILRAHHLDAEATLFVDDLAENRRSAAALGLVTIATETNAPLPPLPK